MLALSVVLWVFCGCSSSKAEYTVATEETAVATETAADAETTGFVPEEGVIVHEGKYYLPREDQLRILAVGLDKKDRKETEKGYTNKMQSDFLLLLVMDKDTKECNILNLNRDIMTTIRKLGFGGAVTGTYEGQLALAHTHGKGGRDSAENVVWSVSNLLGGVPIDHYMTLTMSSIGKLNDLVGGVPVTILEDFTRIDSRMYEGAEIRLNGWQAQEYVRGRRDVADGTNLNRMSRQEQYLYAFYRQFLEKSQQEGADFLGRVLLTVGTSFQTDLDFETLNELRKLLPSCKLNPFQSVAGELVLGEDYYEFHVDEEALMEQIIRLFYQEITPN